MKLCIISNAVSDFSELLSSSFAEVRFLTMEEAAATDLHPYDAFAYLCGTTEDGAVQEQDVRNAIDEQIRLGKPVFAEYCRNIGPLRAYNTVSTRFERPVVLTESPITGGVETRIILDEQSNNRVQYLNPTGTPILHYYKNPFGFYKVPENLELPEHKEDFALFLEKENLLVCSFRLCHFAKAVFAPRKTWCHVLAGIVRWLGGDCQPEDVRFYFEKVYTLHGEGGTVADTVSRGLAWFENADMLVRRNGLPYGAKEGLGSAVYADGTHAISNQIRPDCVGEVSLAYYLQYLLTGDKRMLTYADGLMRCVLDHRDTVPGPWYGMMRWTGTSWWTCYGDDAARGLLLPGLLRTLIGGDRTYLPDVKDCLDFMLSITGSLGLPPARIDFVSEEGEAGSYMGLAWQEDGQKWNYGGGGSFQTKEELRNMPVSAPSGHYQANYLASLLLYYHLTGEKTYLAAGIRGLETIMGHYPATAREHSETQEYCRLLLPLAILWKVSEDLDQPKPTYKEWLYQVASDLNQFRHENGGFREWDTGYMATCAGVKDGESSVMAENGDPVADMLYSLNWLPTALTLAYRFTKDDYFREMRDYMTTFFCKTQVISRDRMLDGIWPRSLDLDAMEVYGVPNDVGWAPWSVETGWTMGEILCGLQLALLEDK